MQGTRQSGFTGRYAPGTPTSRATEVKEAESRAADLRKKMEEGLANLQLIVALVLPVVATVTYAGWLLWDAEHPNWGKLVWSVGLVLSVVAVFFYFQERAKLSDKRVDYDLAIRERDLARLNLAAQDPAETYLKELMAITLDNQSSNYKLVHEQASKSFFVTLVVAVAGFSLIGSGIYFGSGDAGEAAWIGATSGTITELIAGVFFWLYTGTVKQLRTYHNSLVTLQDTLLALQLVQQTDDAEKLTSEIVRALLVERRDGRVSARRESAFQGDDDISDMAKSA